MAESPYSDLLRADADRRAGTAQERIDAQAREINRLQTALFLANNNYQREYDTAQRLRAALLDYGRHKDDCVFWLDDDSDLAAYGPNEGCTCGLYEATLSRESHTPQETTE